MKIYIFAMAALGEGLSGSDRIFIELSRRWSKKHPIVLYLWEEGYSMCKRQNLQKSPVTFQIIDVYPWDRFGFVINYCTRIIASIKISLSLIMEDNPSTVIYSASDFWMDSLPCFILKLRFSKITWVGSWYLTAPNPFKGFKEGVRNWSFPRLNTLFYWLSQRPILSFLKNKANFIFVTSEPDKKHFPRQQKMGKIEVVKGGVNLTDFLGWVKKSGVQPKKYEAIFQGRFHPQKGVLELVDIWKKVVDKKPDAKLVMIGDGPLMQDAKNKIRDLNLEGNIFLKGYVYDGEEKYKLFAQSKILVHPAIYDSGGMAAAEGMVFGLPGVSFDLEALKTYYPKGMLKVPKGDVKEFAELIITLLEDSILYNKTSSDAKELIEKHWNWDKRASEILQQITRNI